jgi:hypothetical protein
MNSAELIADSKKNLRGASVRSHPKSQCNDESKEYRVTAKTATDKVVNRGVGMVGGWSAVGWKLVSHNNET